ncbi:putative transposable element [Trichonephila clavipes]|uniref:Putative transposable element n=1 Tax=Trichonephila clavipes TaxID=2585209 RepID=A0A8X6WJ72_TRICX|nr:putative transposable element [Trichonephila clavipes]
MEINKEKIRYILQFFFDKGENASQVAEIVNGVYGADTVTANDVQFSFRRFRSGILMSKLPHARHRNAIFVEWLRQQKNCRIWSEANPQVYVETPLHPETLTVWCDLWAGGIIGPYFFKNDAGHNVTVNGHRYKAMNTNFFIPELKNHDVQKLWFQQDGATCHTARATIDLLKDPFGDRPISRFGPVNWPPRSCDLTPLDYFLWGYVKSLVYADKPQTLDHLEDNILRVIADIRPQMLEKVIENWTSRLDYIRASRGSHMPEIIFKM